MRRRPDPLKSQQWAERLERFGKSAKTVAQFCQGEGVSSPSFYRWRKRLGGVAKTRGAKRRQRLIKSPGKPSSSPAFKPVDVSSLANSAGVTIRLPDGIVLELGNHLPTIEAVMNQLLDHQSPVGAN